VSDRTELGVDPLIKLWVERRIVEAQERDIAEFRALSERVTLLECNDLQRSKQISELFGFHNARNGREKGEQDSPLTKAKAGLYTALTGAVAAIGYALTEFINWLTEG